MKNHTCLILLPLILLQCAAPSVFIDLTAHPKYREINGYGKKLVIVEAKDRRTDLGRKPESFIGTAFDAHQKKYELYIQKNAGLSETITRAIMDQLKMMNFTVDECDPMLAAPQMDVDQYIKGSKADKVIFIDVYNFSTETALEVVTDWDIGIKIEDTSRNKLFENRKKDITHNDRGSMSPDEASKTVIPLVLQTCLDSLFDEEVVNLLLQENSRQEIKTE
jgi:hypothetical protein